MKQILIWRFLFGFVLVFPQLCSATVITFDSDPPAFQDAYGQGDSYQESGYSFSTTNDPGLFGSIIRFNPDASAFSIPNNGSIHMGVTFYANPWMERIDGGVFDLLSLELGEYSTINRRPKAINLSGTTFEGSVLSASLFIDAKFDGLGGIADFQLYNLNWKNLVRLDFDSTGFSFDNIQVSSAAIPEPGSILLILLGLVLLIREFGIRVKTSEIHNRLDYN